MRQQMEHLVEDMPYGEVEEEEQTPAVDLMKYQLPNGLLFKPNKSSRSHNVMSTFNCVVSSDDLLVILTLLLPPLKEDVKRLCGLWCGFY